MKSNKTVYRFWMLVGVTLIAMLRVNAGNIYWNGAGEDAEWSNTNNWSGKVKPAAGDTAMIGSIIKKRAEVVIRQIDTFGSIVLADGAETWGQLTLVDGNVTAHSISVAQPGSGNISGGSFVQSNGVVVANTVFLGKSGLATGRYELVSGSLDVDVNMYIGYESGDGTFVQRAGSVTSTYIRVGFHDGGSGRYELHGGTLSSSEEHMGGNGGNGRGVFLHADGTNSPNHLLIAGSAGSTAEYWMYAGLLQVRTKSGTTIGNSGAGTLTQTGGTMIVEGDFYIGRAAGSEGLYQLSGGELRVTNACHIIAGLNGKGTFRLGDTSGSGALVKGSGNANFSIRYYEGADGTLEGWGSLPAFSLQNNGRIIADGYGTERTLDLSTIATLTSKKNTLTYSSTHGWFARNRGALRLPDRTPVSNFGWGDSAASFDATDTNQPLVNSVKFECAGAAGTLTGRLLASDHGDVHPGLDRTQSVWDFSGVTYDTATVTIRYDDLAAAACGVVDEDLRVFQHDGSGWRNRTVSIDPVTKTISASLLSPVSQIAVAQMRFGTVLIIN